MLVLERYERMSGFVIGGNPLFLIGEQHGLALGAHEHLVLGQFEVVHHNLLAIDASSIERSFVDHVGKVSATESRGSASKDVEIDVVADGNFLNMHAKDFFTPTNVGQSHNHAAVEAAWAQQRGIEHVGAVGSGNEN